MHQSSIKRFCVAQTKKLPKIPPTKLIKLKMRQVESQKDQDTSKNHDTSRNAGSAAQFGVSCMSRAQDNQDASDNLPNLNVGSEARPNFSCTTDQEQSETMNIRKSDYQSTNAQFGSCNGNGTEDKNMCEGAVQCDANLTKLKRSVNKIKLALSGKNDDHKWAIIKAVYDDSALFACENLPCAYKKDLRFVRTSLEHLYPDKDVVLRKSLNGKRDNDRCFSKKN